MPRCDPAKRRPFAACCALGGDIRGRKARAAGGRPHIDFCRSRTIHFARFAILDDPDRGANRKRLLFSSNYDGDLDGHLAELVEITADMSEIWGRCEGYSGVERFADFIRAHAHVHGAFYIAFRDETVQSIHRHIAVRRGLQLVLDAEPAPALMAALAEPSAEPPWIQTAPRLAAAATRRIVEIFRQVARAAPIVVDAGKALGRWGVANVVEGTQKIAASLGRYPFFRFFNWITGNSLPPQRSAYSSVAVDNCPPWIPLAPGDEIPSASDSGVPPAFREDAITLRISGCPDDPPSHMTIPRRPVRMRTAAVPRFVTVRGGAYLFMPSLTALRFLATF